MLARFRPRLTYANVAATLALVLGMGGGAYAAIDSIPGRGGVIHGCYKRRGGDLRLVGSGKKCSKNERAITFNQQATAFQTSMNKRAEPLTLTLAVPAGSYAVVAKAVGSSDATTGSDPGGAACILSSSGSDDDFAVNTIPPDSLATFVSTIAVTLGTPGTIVYSCAGSGGTPPTRGFYQARIVATRVGTVRSNP